MKVIVNIEVDVPDQFVKNGEPDISITVLGLDGDKTIRLFPESLYIFKENEMITF